MARGKLIFLIFVIALLASFVEAQYTGARYVQYQNSPSFQTYYGQNARTFWPILEDRAECEARQDILLNLAPAGCQPAVVRSDLLAEQNVPVFCQIDALKINPLLDISNIRGISFGGQKPEEIVDVGFHPARVALRKKDKSLDKPLINNVGYMVVVLKREPDEKKLPDFINVTLEAKIDYEAKYAKGVGKAEFILETLSEAEWEVEKYKQSFWNGRYYVRLERADSNFAEVSIFEGNRKVSTTRVEKGKMSNRIFLPGYYCRAGLQIAYDDFVVSDDKAVIEVSSNFETNIFDAYKNSKFLDGRCRILSIKMDADGKTGSVVGNCKGKRFVLELKSRKKELDVLVVEGKAQKIEQKIQGDNIEYRVDLTNLKDKNKRGIYLLNAKNELIKFNSEDDKAGKRLIDGNGRLIEQVENVEPEWLLKVWEAIKEYKERKSREDSGEVFGTKELGRNVRGYYVSAIESYEKVAEDFPEEKKDDIEDIFYGELALRNAISLSSDFGMNDEKIRLIEKYSELYKNGSMSEKYKEDLARSLEIDTTNATEFIELDGNEVVIRLVGFKKAKKKPVAEFLIEGEIVSLKKGESRNLEVLGREIGFMKVEEISTRSVLTRAFCKEGNRTIEYNFNVGAGERKICGVARVKLVDVDVWESARIRLISSIDSSTVTNLTVGVGIEKRAIKLTPEKAIEKIENLNKSIEKWNKISENLGKVVSGLKGACFATSALLTFKNLVSGFSGETLARQQVMQVWKPHCEKLVAEGKYPNINVCYLQESGKIDKDVSIVASSINKMNAEIQNIQSQPGVVSSSGIFGVSVDADKVRKHLAERATSLYGNVEINTSQLRNVWRDEGGNIRNSIKVSELLSKENVERGVVSTEDIKQIMLFSSLQNNREISAEFRENFDEKLSSIADRISEQRRIRRDLENAKEYEKRGFPAPLPIDNEHYVKRSANVVELPRNIADPSEGVTHITTISVPAASSTDGEINFEGGVYVLGLDNGGNVRGREFSVKDVWKEIRFGNSYTYKKLENKEKSEFLRVYKVGNIVSADSMSYNNEIVLKDRVVRYFEVEPYRGMPAIVPFDVRNGWYAATRQTLPIFGGIGAFDASGRVTSFWLCNVGKNGMIEFETGFGDDLCQQFNLQTGQPPVFPGLSEREAISLRDRAIRAIEEAANQYGNKRVRILGQPFDVGQPATGRPGTQCQDFMSPKECLLLFNVCDPVICPASRCDLGGTFPVANVPQTGIIGSIFLCLPNIREGVVIPVCLTGIQAGIDGYVSILKNYRDCLQENLKTGRMVGICDQIYSIYICDFFWNQIAPFVNVLIPKIIEIAYGQGVRGGAEYLTVQSAWQNMENSLNYFTQHYAVNSFQAFQVRTSGKYGQPFTLQNAIAEIGTQVCKGFVSAKAPQAFKALIQPDSPPQFHAWFDSVRYSDVTVPATARYKVFYHIYAGRDSGVYYDVYLKSPPESSYYNIAPFVRVASGFIQANEYASDTRDFTAPEGYKELCVRINAQEECGFKQVTTSFAVNYLRDIYVKDQITNNRITSERECIGGSPSLYTMINPNIQSGVENTIAPQIYNRGIIRICSSENPGKGTNEERFVDVGYCDNEKIRCWLDKRSVDNAITSNNIGIKNETLSELESQVLKFFEEREDLLPPDVAVLELRGLEERAFTLERVFDLEEARGVLDDVKKIEKKLFYNSHKARALFIKGRVNEIVARKFYIEERKKILRDRPSASVREEDDTPLLEEDLENQIGSEEEQTIEKYVFTVGDREGIFYNLLFDGEKTGYSFATFIVGGKEQKNLYRKSGATNEIIGEINDTGHIKLKQNASSLIPEQEIEKLEGGIVLFRVLEGKCTIKKAWWENEKKQKINVAKNGERVFMVISGEGNCTKKEVSLVLLEYDWLGNDLVLSKKVDKFEINNFGFLARVEWRAEWIDDGMVGGDPEYFFEAYIGNQAVLKSDNLKVTEEKISNNQEQNKGNLKNYSLKKISYAEKNAEVDMIFFGGNKTEIYTLNTIVYVEFEGEDQMVGTVVQSGRINIVNLDEINVNIKIKKHLEFLNGKFYSDLRKGILQRED